MRREIITSQDSADGVGPRVETDCEPRIRRGRWPAVVVVAGLFGACGGPQPQAPRPDGDGPPRRGARTLLGGLGPGAVKASHRDRDEIHVYHLTLDRGTYIRLVVQAAVGVSVRLRDPAGSEVLAVGAPDAVGAPAPLDALAAQGGTYALEIGPAEAARGGTYSARLELARPAADRDVTAVRAAQAYAESERLARRGIAFAPRRRALGEEARAGWRALGEPAREALALLAVGGACFDLRDLAAALEAYEDALALYRHGAHRSGQGRVHVAMGPVLRLLGRPQRAEKGYRQALLLAEQAGDAALRADTLVNLGRLRDSQGDGDGAIALFEQAVPIWEALGREDRMASALEAMGSAETLLGRTDEARDVLDRALGLHRKLGNKRAQAETLMLLGSAQAAEGVSGEALATFGEAIRLYRQVGDETGAVVASQRSGWALMKEGRAAEAVRVFEDALAFFRRQGAPLEEANCLASLAPALAAAGASERAHEVAVQALQLLTERRRDPVAEASVRLADASALADLGRLADADVEAGTALALVESGRSQVRGVPLRRSYLGVRQAYYEFATDLQMRRHALAPGAGHDGRALEIAERGRARGLLDGLVGARNGSRSSHPADPAERAAAALATHINTLARQRFDLTRRGAAAAELARIDARLRARLRERDRLEGRLAAAGAQGAPLGLRGMRALLDEDTTVLFYALGERRSFVWRLTSQDLRVRELPPRRTIEALARRVVQQLPRSREWGRRAAVERELVALGSAVLGPLRGPPGGRRLVVVPDGALHVVPFSALPLASLDGEPPPEGSPDEPLASRYEVVTLPSLSSLAELRRVAAARRPTRRELAAVADPVFERSDARLGGGAARVSEPGPLDPAGRDLARSARALGLERFERLPHTRVEAEAAVSAAGARDSLIALDFDASRDLALSGRLGPFRILHFATHALLNPSQPELSGLVLARLDREGREVDGFLRAHEIAGLHLGAELVILSACRTALGKEVQGEGPLGLTQAFFRAGALRVIVSLWNVSDRATAELMGRFYAGLFARGLSPAQALREAQLALRNDARFSAPYYWAGFILQGDWRQPNRSRARRVFQTRTSQGGDMAQDAAKPDSRTPVGLVPVDDPPGGKPHPLAVPGPATPATVEPPGQVRRDATTKPHPLSAGGE